MQPTATHQCDLGDAVDAKPEAEEVLQAARQRARISGACLLLAQVAQLEEEVTGEVLHPLCLAEESQGAR